MPNVTIMTPSRIISNNLMNMSRMCVEDMILPWENIRIRVFAILSHIDAFNSQKYSFGKIDISRESSKNVLEYMELENISIVVPKFNVLGHNMLNERLTFPMSTSLNNICYWLSINP